MTTAAQARTKHNHIIPAWTPTLCILFLLCTATHAATVTNTSDTGAGSLRWAIANTPSGGTVDFDRAVWDSTIRLSSELAIDNTTLTVQALTAADMAISGEKRCRVFYIARSHVTLKGLTIENGHDNTYGAGILSGISDLTMRNCTVRNCALDARSSTTTIAYSACGAGICCTGLVDDFTLLMENCTITSNLIVIGTPGTLDESLGTGMVAGSGGKVAIRNSVFSNNVAVNHDLPSARISGVGAAFSNTSGTIQNCVFRDNMAVADVPNATTNVCGNALNARSIGYAEGNQSLTVRQCRLTGNRTDAPSNRAGLGSVVGIDYFDSLMTLENVLIDNNLGNPIYTSASDVWNSGWSAALHLRNTTITGNTADSSLIRSENSKECGIHLTHCTIAGNTLPEGTNAVDMSDPYGDAYLEANVIANNVSGDAVELYGPFTTNGYNVIDSYDAVTTTILLNGPGDRVGINPMLGPLAYNGGPTLTMMPLPGSPLIDAIPSTATLIAWDQRCAPRPYENGSEIGACETGEAWKVRFQRDQTVAVTTDEPTWTAVWDYATGQWTASLETAVPAILAYPLSVDDITGIYLYNLGAGSFHESIHNWHQLW